jgi:Mn-containing catalase
MHQQQWLAVIEELGGSAALPIPNSFDQSKEQSQFSYAYFGHRIDGQVPAGRWTEGASLDGKGQFSAMRSEPLGGEPMLAPPRPGGGAQAEQMTGAAAGGAMAPQGAANDPSLGGGPSRVA